MRFRGFDQALTAAARLLIFKKVERDNLSPCVLVEYENVFMIRLLFCLIRLYEEGREDERELMCAGHSAGSEHHGVAEQQFVGLWRGGYRAFLFLVSSPPNDCFFVLRR